MLSGNARISLLNPDGAVFIDDVSKGDLWYFPAGYPHSIQGLGREALATLPKGSLYIFPAALPKSLAEDRAAVGGGRVQSPRPDMPGDRTSRIKIQGGYGAAPESYRVADLRSAK